MQDNLFEQFATITKASAYDIVSKQVGELKEVIRELIEEGELDKMATNPGATDRFKKLVKKAKILSFDFNENEPS